MRGKWNDRENGEGSESSARGGKQRRKGGATEIKSVLLSRARLKEESGRLRLRWKKKKKKRKRER